MSLINQMLRDLEQRNNPPSQTSRTLDVRMAAKPASGRPGVLWLLAVTALTLAVILYQNQAGQPVQPVAGAVSEPQPAVSTVPAEPSAEPNRIPLAASAPLAAPNLSEPTPVVAAEPKVLPAELPKLAVSPFPANEPLKIAEASSAVASKPAVRPPSPERRQSPSPVPAPTEKLKSSKPPTAGEQAEALYRQAQRSASVLMAKENLKEALQLEPRHLPARTLLLQTLVKSRADAELVEFADESLALFPENLLFIKTRAHLYVQQKNFAGAVSLLERLDAERVNDSAYLALLAAGYQQLQRFSQAARIYQQLTEIQPDKAENWLGLAIAQDKLNQSQAAAQSYRHALDEKTLNAEVVGYINQRLSALNP